MIRFPNSLLTLTHTHSYKYRQMKSITELLELSLMNKLITSAIFRYSVVVRWVPKKRFGLTITSKALFILLHRFMKIEIDEICFQPNETTIRNNLLSTKWQVFGQIYADHSNFGPSLFLSIFRIGWTFKCFFFWKRLAERNRYETNFRIINLPLDFVRQFSFCLTFQFAVCSVVRFQHFNDLSLLLTLFSLFGQSTFMCFLTPKPKVSKDLEHQKENFGDNTFIRNEMNNFCVCIDFQNGEKYLKLFSRVLKFIHFFPFLLLFFYHFLKF